MAKTKEEKRLLKDKYGQFFQDYAGFIAVDTDKLDNQTITELKKSLRESGAVFMVVKNTIFKISAQEADLPLQVQEFENATGIIGFTQDPVTPAKLIKQIAEEKEVLSPKFAVVEGKYLEADQAMRLADIGTREELLGRLVGTLNAPLSGFASVVTGNVRGFVQVLKQLSEKEA